MQTTNEILESLRASIENDIRARILANLGAAPKHVTNGKALQVPKPKNPPKRGAPVGAKRTPGEIAKTADAVLAFVKAHPGTNAEAIQKELGEPLSVITLPIKKLLANKALSRKGQKRATRYYAKKGGA